MTPKPYASPALTWFQPDAKDNHDYTMGVANDSEGIRTAAINDQKLSDEWRGEGPVTPWGGALNQKGSGAQWSEGYEPMTPKPYASPALTWFQPAAKVNHDYTMGVANTDEAQRNAAIKAESDSNVWRKTTPPTAWEALNQKESSAQWSVGYDPMTPKPYASPPLTWFQPDAKANHAYTMGVANTDEAQRNAAIKAEADSNVWRKVKTPTPWAALNQKDSADQWSEGYDPLTPKPYASPPLTCFQPKSKAEQAVTAGLASDSETARTKAINEE